MVWVLYGRAWGIFQSPLYGLPLAVVLGLLFSLQCLLVNVCGFLAYWAMLDAVNYLGIRLINGCLVQSDLFMLVFY
jgi:hypothetical protein